MQRHIFLHSNLHIKVILKNRLYTFFPICLCILSTYMTSLPIACEHLFLLIYPFSQNLFDIEKYFLHFTDVLLLLYMSKPHWLTWITTWIQEVTWEHRDLFKGTHTVAFRTGALVSQLFHSTCHHIWYVVASELFEVKIKSQCVDIKIMDIFFFLCSNGIHHTQDYCMKRDCG